MATSYLIKNAAHPEFGMFPIDFRGVRLSFVITCINRVADHIECKPPSLGKGADLPQVVLTERAIAEAIKIFIHEDAVGGKFALDKLDVLYAFAERVMEITTLYHGALDAEKLRYHKWKRQNGSRREVDRETYINYGFNIINELRTYLQAMMRTLNTIDGRVPPHVLVAVDKLSPVPAKLPDIDQGCNFASVAATAVIQSCRIKYEIEQRLLHDYLPKPDAKPTKKNVLQFVDPFTDPPASLPSLAEFCADLDNLRGLTVATGIPNVTIHMQYNFLSTWMLLANVFAMVGRHRALMEHVEALPSSLRRMIFALLFVPRDADPEELAEAAVWWQSECAWCLEDMTSKTVVILSCCIVGDAGPFHCVCSTCAERFKVRRCVICKRKAEQLTPEEACQRLRDIDPEQARIRRGSPTRNDMLVHCVGHSAEMAAQVAQEHRRIIASAQ